MRKLFLGGLTSVVVLLLVIQLVPYGRSHANPPVTQQPDWDAQTQELVSRACADCHSNETVWPWYSNIAPISWLVQHDVEEGRTVLNFSDWGRSLDGEAAEEVPEVISEGEMPPGAYLLLHGKARLTDAEKEQLIQGLTAVLTAVSNK